MQHDIRRSADRLRAGLAQLAAANPLDAARLARVEAIPSDAKQKQVPCDLRTEWMRAGTDWLRRPGHHLSLELDGEVRWVADKPDSGEDAEPVEPVKRTRQRRPTPVARQAALPPTLTPRLIGRDAAAAYVGVSPNTFDKMIAEGLMPSPRRLTERRLAWDLRQLDTAIDRLPSDGDAEADTDATDDHSWNDIDAQATKKPIAH